MSVRGGCHKNRNTEVSKRNIQLGVFLKSLLEKLQGKWIFYFWNFHEHDVSLRSYLHMHQTVIEHCGREKRCYLNTVQMWELNHKEGWALKNWCFQTVVLEKTLESSLDSKEIKPVNPKRNQPWIYIGRIDADVEVRKLWLPDVKSQLIEKDPDAGKDWGPEEKRVRADEIVGWHYRLNGHEFEQTPGYSEGQGSLMCYSPWGFRVRHDWVTEQQPQSYFLSE